MKEYKILFNEMAYIGDIKEIRIEVHTDHQPYHFHAIKKNIYDVRISIYMLEVMSYKFQKNSIEINTNELKQLKKWLQEPNNKQKKLTNLEAIKLAWNQLNPDKEI